MPSAEKILRVALNSPSAQRTPLFCNQENPEWGPTGGPEPYSPEWELERLKKSPLLQFAQKTGGQNASS